MTNAVLIGCGGKNVKPIVDACIGRFTKIYNIGSTELHNDKITVTNIKVDWKTFHLAELHKTCKDIEDVGFMFFNQNGSSLNGADFDRSIGVVDTIVKIKSWTQSHWISCQMPFAIIQHLAPKFTKDVKLGWMLSGFIDYRKKDVYSYPDYSANKFTNYVIMKSFSKTFNCFGIDPDFTKQNLPEFLNTIFENNENYNGKVFGID
tara:strand:+ start:833 stop:1447 length:615 start_codon:yes stop_codon:yes gene_type:complete